MNILREITKQAQEFLTNSRGSHDWQHTLRVYNLCMRIGKKEKADLEILKMAVILHDIAWPHQDKSGGKICHAQKGSELAQTMLTKLGVDEKKIEQVVHCIRTHRIRGNNIPISKEAKILFDADKLDGIGAIGIGRAFMFSGEAGDKMYNKNMATSKNNQANEDTTYREYLVTLLKIKGRMMTKEGRRIAGERHKFMVAFFDRFKKEVEGQL